MVGLQTDWASPLQMLKSTDYFKSVSIRDWVSLHKAWPSLEQNSTDDYTFTRHILPRSVREILSSFSVSMAEMSLQSAFHPLLGLGFADCLFRFPWALGSKLIWKKSSMEQKKKRLKTSSEAKSSLKSAIWSQALGFRLSVSGWLVRGFPVLFPPFPKLCNLAAIKPGPFGPHGSLHTVCSPAAMAAANAKTASCAFSWLGPGTCMRSWIVPWLHYLVSFEVGLPTSSFCPWWALFSSWRVGIPILWDPISMRRVGIPTFWDSVSLRPQLQQAPFSVALAYGHLCLGPLILMLVRLLFGPHPRTEKPCDQDESPLKADAPCRPDLMPKEIPPDQDESPLKADAPCEPDLMPRARSARKLRCLPRICRIRFCRRLRGGRRAKRARNRHRHRAARKRLRRLRYWCLGRLPVPRACNKTDDDDDDDVLPASALDTMASATVALTGLTGHDTGALITSLWQVTRTAIALSLCLLWICQLAWDPHTGVRIGEASNPGPGPGANTEASLREALLTVLQSFAQTPSPPKSTVDRRVFVADTAEDPTAQASRTGNGPHGGKGKRQGGSKGKGQGGDTTSNPRPLTPTPPRAQDGNEQSLHHKLLAILSKAAQDSWSDASLAQAMIKELQSEATVIPSPSPRTVKGQDEGAVKGRKPLAKREASETTKGKGKQAASRHGKGKSKVPQHRSAPASASRVLASEWDTKPELTDVAEISKSLNQGEPLPGNLIIARDRAIIEEIEAIFSAFDVSAPLSIAVVNPALPNLPTVAVWWGQKKAFDPPQRVKLQMFQASDFPGPMPKPPASVKLRHTDVKLVTLRMLAPSFYRQLIPGAPMEDTPASVIAQLAQVAQCRTAMLTGGRWEKVSHKRGAIIIGHVKVPEPIALRLLAESGRHALFCTLLSKDGPKTDVAWIPKQSQHTDEDYYSFATSQAAKHHLPLALRQGGGNDIGLAGADPLLYTQARASHWVIYGAPRAWTETDVSSFLHEVGWRQISVLTRKRGRKRDQPSWVIKALMPENQSLDSFSYSDEAQDLCITIAPEIRSKKRAAAWDTQPLKAPKKLWVDRSRKDDEEIAATLADQSDDDDAKSEPSVRCSKPKARAAPDESRDKSRSPRHKVPEDRDRAKVISEVTVDADKIMARTLGLTPVDCGGAGDCAFRSLAYLIARQQSKSLDSEQLSREAASLRLKCSLHLTKHQKELGEFWAPDAETDIAESQVPPNVDIWGGCTPPNSFGEYLKLVPKAATWADGLMLESLAQRLGTPVLIWIWSSTCSSWSRVVLAPWITEGCAGRARKAPLPLFLALKDGHFRALINKDEDHPHSCPEAWLKETPRRSLQELRGAGKDSLLSLASRTPVRTCASSMLSVPDTTPQKRVGSSLKAASRTQASNKASLKALPLAASGNAGQVTTEASQLPIDPNPFEQRPKGNSKGTEVRKPPWAKDVIRHHGVIARLVAHPDMTLRWTCKCGRHLDSSNSAQLSSMRNNHCSRAHQGDKDLPPLYRTQDRPKVRRVPKLLSKAWECARCHKGIPSGEGTTALVAEAARQHLIECQGPRASLHKNRWALEKTQRDAALQPRDFYYKKAFQRATLWSTTRKACHHVLTPVFLPTPLGRKGVKRKQRHYNWICSICARTWTGCTTADRAATCGGYKARKQTLGKKLAAWILWRQKCPDAASSFAQAISASKKEVNALDRAARKRGQTLPPIQAKRWYRDLTREGIEPNPGPSLATSNEVRVYFHNTNGLDNAYQSVQEATRDKPHIIGLVEVGAKQDQRPALIAHLQKRGYRAWYFGRDDLKNAIGVSYSNGGMLVALRRDVKGGVSDFVVHNAGEAALLDMGLFSVAVGWSRPKTETGVFEQHLAAWASLATQKGKAWLAVADWNELPDNNQLVQAGARLIAQQHQPGQYTPTRWTSSRCIDYGISNMPHGQVEIHLGEKKLSDHKFLHLHFKGVLQPDDGHQLQPTPDFRKPCGVSTKDWRHAIAQHYDTTPIPQGDSDEEWSYLSRKASAALKQAYAALGGRPHFKGTRPKGSMPRTRPLWDPQQKMETTAEHCISLHLGRLYEARRQQQRGHLQRALRDRIEQHRPADIPPGFDDGAIAAAEAALLRIKKERKTHALRNWRNKMRENSRYLGNWLHQKALMLPSTMTEEDVTTGEIRHSSSTTESLCFVKRFWQQTWNRSADKAIAAAKNLEKQAPEVPPCAFSITAHDLYATAQRRKQGSAGPDGWMQAELASLPVQHWHDVIDLLQRWQRRNRYPACWQHARMVVIPKGDMDKLGALATNRTRPITIFACHYRIVMTALSRSSKVRDWLRDSAPEFSHGAIQGRSATNALAMLEAYFHGSPGENTLVSLDMKQCFDNVHPRLALACLRNVGFDPIWLSLAGWVWNSQHRWIQMGREVSREAAHVTSSVPQGCPLAPLAVVILLMAPAREIESKIGSHVRQSLFLDDRAAVCDSATTGLQYIDAWKSACSDLDLIENGSKLQIHCAQPTDDLFMKRSGIPAKALSQGAKVLGAGFGQTSTAEVRGATACALLARISLLPGDAQFRERAYRQRVLPLLNWGSWWQGHPEGFSQDWISRARRSLSAQHVANRGLWCLLQGHWVDPDICLLLDSLRAWLRAARYWKKCGHLLPTGRWLSFIHQGLQDHGFRISGHVAQHPSGASLHLAGEADAKQLEAALHQVREAWRQQQFKSFLDNPRREAVDAVAAGVQYDAAQSESARKLFDAASSEERGVMLGASFSLAAHEKVFDGLPKHAEVHAFCPFCKCAVVPSWKHLAWDCCHFAEDRGSLQKPACPLSWRLGWPQVGEKLRLARSRLQFLARVRAAVREHAWRS